MNLGGKRIDGRTYSLFAVRMYSSKPERGQIYYWSPDGDWQGFVFANVRKGWHTYVVDLTKADTHGPGGGSDERKRWGGASGEVDRFRFDPVNGAGTDVRIDWIRLLRADETVRAALEDVRAEKKVVMAVDARKGTVLWQRTFTNVMSSTLAASDGRAFLQTSRAVIGLDGRTGQELWRVERESPLGRPDWAAPTLVVRDGVVLSADRVVNWKSSPATRKQSIGERLKRRWPPSRLIALDANDGRMLWECPAGDGYHAPVDVFVADGLVWVGKEVGRHAGDFAEGRDLRTGEVKRRLTSDAAFTPNHHHRCYRNKATETQIVLGRTGIEFIDLKSGDTMRHDWVRGSCQYGVLPCNGLLYAPPHSCACYIQSKLNGFLALASKAARSTAASTRRSAERVERGPAYSRLSVPNSTRDTRPATDWPTYRHDTARSGCASTSLAPEVQQRWRTDLRGRITSPVVAGGKVFVAAVDRHTVHALSATDGKPAWRYTAGGRVDSPPTVTEGLVFFGCADGYAYCLLSEDGRLVWRTRVAPEDQWVMAFDQVESTWPVHGSVLVRDGIVTCAAGRTSYLDGGISMCRLDAKTGEVLTEFRLYSRDPVTGAQHESESHGMDLGGALPDILSSDGEFVFMRHVRLDPATLRPLDEFQAIFEPDPDWSKRHAGGHPLYQNLERGPHLFSPTGFLDDAWWHRSYWVYGTHFLSCCPYYTAAVYAPAGRILAFDDSHVYGYARKGKFWGWWTPLEYHLFATNKTATYTQTQQKTKRGRDLKNWQGIIRLGTYATRIKFDWSEDVPIHVRAMVVTDSVPRAGAPPGKTLFVAGSPDVLDETTVDMRELMHSDALTREALDASLAAWEGSEGAVLRAVTAKDGKTLSELKLDALPVFDGMAAANGRLYVSLQDGSVLCLE